MKLFVIVMLCIIVNFIFEQYEKSKLDQLWEYVVNIGMKTRKEGMDRKTTWRLIENHYEYFDNAIPKLNWTQHALSRYKIMTAHPFNIVDEKINDDWDYTKILEWKLNHFFLQHSRIVQRNPYNFQFTKLLQIAYNCGQFKAEEHNYNVIFKEYYNKNNLCDYRSYIDDTQILKIDKNLNYVL